MKSLLGLSLGFPKWYIMTPILPKLTNLFGSLEMGLLQNKYLVEGPMDPAHLINIWLFCCANPENFSLFHSADQKLFHFYFQTDRHTDRCTFCIPRCTGNIFYLWKIIPFTILCSFVTWFAHSLTSFGKKKFQIRWSKNNLTKNNLSASWLCQLSKFLATILLQN